MSASPEALTSESIPLKYGELSALVSPNGAWLEQFEMGNEPILFPKTIINGKARGGCHVCMPNFGPAQPEDNLKQHGFGRDSLWAEQERTDNETTLLLSGGPAPYAGLSAQLNYLLDDRGLRMTLLVQNNGTEPFRMAPGFHPYFASGSAQTVEVDGAPYNRTDLNPAKFLDQEVGQLKIGARMLTLHSEGMPQWVLWTDGSGDYTCLEPTQCGASFEEKPDDDEMLAAGVSRVWALRISAN